MTDNPSKDDDRVHPESPAEGDPDADPTDIRVHPQEPAEGADPDGPGGDKSQ